MANDPLHNLVQIKSLDEIITAAKETIKRHRRRFLQRNLRPCPVNCKGASMLGHKVVGCTNCGSPNAENCIKENKFVPLFTKEELAQQFADQLRDPDVLLREYRDVTVFLWVLGAFDKQKKTLNENIVEKVEQREKSKAVSAGADSSNDQLRVRDSLPSDSDRPAKDGNKKSASDNE